jgi:hypothetical protein
MARAPRRDRGPLPDKATAGARTSGPRGTKFRTRCCKDAAASRFAIPGCTTQSALPARVSRRPVGPTRPNCGEGQCASHRRLAPRPLGLSRTARCRPLLSSTRAWFSTRRFRGFTCRLAGALPGRVLGAICAGARRRARGRWWRPRDVRGKVDTIANFTSRLAIFAQDSFPHALA